MITLKVDHTCVMEVDHTCVMDGKPIDRGCNIQPTGEQTFYEADIIKVHKVDYKKEICTMPDLPKKDFLLPHSAREEEGICRNIIDINECIYYEAILSTKGKGKGGDKIVDTRFVYFTSGFLINSSGKTIEKF